MFDREAYMKKHNKKYREEHPGYFKKYCTRWRKDNPEYMRDYCRNNRVALEEKRLRRLLGEPEGQPESSRRGI